MAEVCVDYSQFVAETQKIRTARRRNLQPHGIQTSFYGKAEIERRNGNALLYSYGTLVAWIDGEGMLHRVWDGYSLTTTNHINAFLAECNGKCVTREATYATRIGKPDWENLPVEEYRR